MKAKVDKDSCIGCGLCEATSPEVFAMDDNVAVVKADPVPAGAEESAKEAAESCPTGAITIEE